MWPSPAGTSEFRVWPFDPDKWGCPKLLWDKRPSGVGPAFDPEADARYQVPTMRSLLRAATLQVRPASRFSKFGASL